MGSSLGMVYGSTAPFLYLPLGQRRRNSSNLGAAESLFLYLGGSRRCAGLPLFLLNAVKFLVLPEDKSKGRRDDMIGRAADELRIAVEGVCQRFFKLEFAGDGLRWFLDKGHCGSPFEAWPV